MFFGAAVPFTFANYDVATHTWVYHYDAVMDALAYDNSVLFKEAMRYPPVNDTAYSHLDPWFWAGHGRAILLLNATIHQLPEPVAGPDSLICTPGDQYHLEQLGLIPLAATGASETELWQVTYAIAHGTEPPPEIPESRLYLIAGPLIADLAKLAYIQ